MKNVSSEKQIKKDLVEIYRVLFKGNEFGSLSGFIDSKVVSRLKHSVEDVERVVLADTKQPKLNNGSLSKEVFEIKTEQEVYGFYIKNLSLVCKATTSEEDNEASLKAVSLHDLKHLYSILTGVEIKAKITKKDVVYKLKDYFDNVERTRDLSKTILENSCYSTS